MDEIAGISRNGLTVVSTFSGCGGSCLGFRMAGFRTVWASEFVPAARETYAANFPEVPLDARDIREVTGDDVRKATGLDEFDVLEGSPPCASFSASGRREEGWGDVRKYSDTKQRVDDLFFEFTRLVADLRPRVFVAENVKGLIAGKAIGYYKRILKAFESAGYVVQARILDAQWLGVPQRRERVVLVGLRGEVALRAASRGREFEWPVPWPYRFTVRDALPDLGRVEGAGHRTSRDLTDEPVSTIHGEARENPTEKDRIPHVVMRYVDRDSSVEGIEQYAIGREAATLRPGRFSTTYQNLIVADPSEPSPALTASGGAAGTASVVHPNARRKFSIDELRALCGFPPDFVLTGTYSQQWERLGRAVPPPMMRAVAEQIARSLGV